MESLTLHLGVAARISMTDYLYIRPDVRYVYIDGVDLGFDNRSYLNAFTASVSLGWLLGK
jgi:hypothetical protein